MQRSLSQLLSACVLAGATAVGTSLFSAAAFADSFTVYQPSFLRQADRALSRGEPARALDIINSNTERRLKSQHQAEALSISCRAHLAMDNPVDAREACEDALALDGSQDSWRYLNNLGVAELTLGNYDAAEHAFTRAATISRNEGTARHNLNLLEQLRAEREAASGERVANTIR